MTGRARQGAGARRKRMMFMAAVALLVTGGVLVAIFSSSPVSRVPSGKAASAGGSSPLPAGVTLLATLRGSATTYASPAGAAARWVPGTWHRARSILPVVKARPGRVEVRLAQQPNGSKAWVPAKDVELSTIPYRIVINLATKHLSLYKDDRKVFSTSAGVGTTTDPTPTGHYFVALLETPPKVDVGDGAFIMVTSAHSDTISNWDHSGDAVIGIHGPLDSDEEIGTAGAQISHGCIRLHERDLLRMRDVPPGSPIDIVR